MLHLAQRPPTLFVDVTTNSLLLTSYEVLRSAGYTILRHSSTRIGNYVVHVWLLGKRNHIIMMIRIESVNDLRRGRT